MQLTAHCADCHDSITTEGELDLSRLFTEQVTTVEKSRLLEKLLKRVLAEEMPPPGASSFSTDERKKLVNALNEEMDALANRLRDDPGEIAMPRLTPYEYRNVIRDLTAGVVTTGGRLLPNEGGAGEGFSNVGAAQVMTAQQYEKYIDAAKETLRHLRVYPTLQPELVWNTFPRPPVDRPSSARKELTDQVIEWYIGQQQKWGEEHRSHLEQKLGFVHAAYLEAAWNYNNRSEAGKSIEAFAHLPSTEESEEKILLAPTALKKWWNILNDQNQNSPHARWAAAWRQLAAEKNLQPAEVRKRCVAIVSGQSNVIIETEDYAPIYEISFHEAKEEVLQAAEQEGRWPFRIEIGDAQELFLVVTDAGDGGQGEYAVWSQGRFVFKDGTARPWQEVVSIIGANSGREYPFGYDGEGSKQLTKDAVGAKPPGALKFAVPENAIVFEVSLTLDKNRTQRASIQALVLKEKPKSQSYVPGRFVFGGKKRPVSAQSQIKKEQERALRKRNIAEANKTKIGLNAERNVFAKWNRTPIDSIGGPWPEQDAEKYESEFPYHYTVAEVLQNARSADFQQLRTLEDRLVSLATEEDESELLSRARKVIMPFASKAWRRDVTENESKMLLQLYQKSRRSGLSFDSSVKSSLLAVLASPHYIYKEYYAVADNKPDQAAQDLQKRGISTAPLSSHALATRLSFFLWGSQPDEELLSLAAKDQLREPAVLFAQTERMLQDPHVSVR